MIWLAARRSALGLSLAVSLCACSAVAPYLSGETPASPIARDATPTESAPSGVPAATASPTTAPAATATPPDSSVTAEPLEPTPAVAASPADALGLVYARGTSVLQTGYLGGETHEIATIPPYDSWAFDNGRLALALGPAVEVLDLVQGDQRSLHIATDAPITFSEVHWGPEEGTLLHVAWVDDATAPTHGRRVELRTLAPTDGRVLGEVILPDVAGVTVLRYVDVAGGTVAITPRRDAAPAEVWIVDLQRGETVAVHPLAGEGTLADAQQPAAISPDLSQVVAVGTVDGAAGLWLHALGGDARARGWRCPPGTRPDALAWSPDGHLVAFVLQPDPERADGTSDDLGVWVLNAASPADTLDVRFVMAETSAASLAGWTPEGYGPADTAPQGADPQGADPQGRHIVGYHRGAASDDAYLFAVRPDGGDRRILNLGADAVALGWMPLVDAAAATAVRAAIDPWAARFAQTIADPEALAAVTAAFVAAHADQPAADLSAALAARVADAGWPADVRAPQVLPIAEGLYVAQLPPQNIYLLEGPRAQQVASGHLVLDARREGDALGLIYGTLEEGAAGASGIQPMFLLLGREADGTWAPRWSPQGQRDWIATDGAIRFVGEGVERLHVSGTSLGILLGPADAMVECRTCLRRELAATWRREGEGYARESALRADAALADILWEMTQPSPYAVVHEALRRARAAEDAADVATPQALASLEALGLLAEGVRLVPEAMQVEEGIVRLSGDSGTHYVATVRDGQLVAITTDSG